MAATSPGAVSRTSETRCSRIRAIRAPSVPSNEKEKERESVASNVSLHAPSSYFVKKPRHVRENRARDDRVKKRHETLRDESEAEPVHHKGDSRNLAVA